MPVVGMVASAGGLEAFRRFLQKMPAKSGIAFVLIPHFDPRRESLMAPLLGKHTGAVAFAEGATVLIHDAQYTPEEKAGPKAGWGHSTWQEAALTARAARVGTLYLSHHDPDRADRELYRILGCARALFPATELASEGTTVALP